MTALLPQNDPGQKARQRELAAARIAYTYDHAKLAPLTLVGALPRSEEFSLDWIFQVAERTLTVLENHSEFAGDPDRKAEAKAAHGLFSGILRSLTMDLDGLFKVIEQVLGVSNVTGHLEQLTDYQAMFRTIPMPAVEQDWADDLTFAHMRLGGPNPVMVKRLHAADPRLPVTPAQYARAVAGDSLDAALAQGRLYLADYAMLAGV